MNRKLPRNSFTKVSSKRTNRIGFLMIVLFVCIVVVMKLIISINDFSTINVQNPLKEALNTHFYTIPGVRRTLYIYVNSNQEIEKCFAILASNEDAGTTIYNIPPWVYVQEYSDVFDSIVPVKNLLYVGDQVNQKRKYEYAIWQIQNITALTFDSYIIVNETANDVSSQLYSNDLSTLTKISDYSAYFKSFSTFTTLLNSDKFKLFATNIYSNKDLFGLYDTYSSFSSLVNEDSYLVDITDKFGTIEKTLVNGEVVKFLNYSEVDKKLQENVTAIKGKVLQKEQVRVEVYNGSDVPKAAERFARFVSNSGCLVVRYANASDVSEVSKIYVTDPKKYSESLRVVEEIFVHKPEVIVGRPEFLTTGDIVVILGNDIQKEISWE